MKALPTVTLVFDGGRQTREAVWTDHTGRFSCGGMPPGDVEVQLVYKQWIEKSSLRSAPPHSFGKFTIDLNAPLKVKLEVPQELRVRKQR